MDFEQRKPLPTLDPPVFPTDSANKQSIKFLPIRFKKGRTKCRFVFPAEVKPLVEFSILTGALCGTKNDLLALNLGS